MQSPMQPQKKSTGFSNIQDINKANVGVGSALASKVSTGVQQAQQKAEDTLQGVSSGFSAAKEAEKNRLEGASNVKAQLQSTKGISDMTPDQIKEAMDLAYNPGKTAELSTQFTSGLQNIQQQQNLAEQGVQQLGSETGRSNLLKQSLKSGRFGRGANILDQSIMQTEGADALQAARLAALQKMGSTQSGVADYLSNQAEIEALTKQAKDISTELSGDGETGGLIGEASKRFMSEQEEQRAAMQAKADEFTQRASSGNLTRQEMQALGLTGTEVLYGLKDLAPGMLGGRTVTLQDVLDMDDAGAYNALSALTKNNLGIQANPEDLLIQKTAAEVYTGGNKEAFKQALDAEKAKAMEALRTSTTGSGTSYNDLYSYLQNNQGADPLSALQGSQYAQLNESDMEAADKEFQQLQAERRLEILGMDP